MKVQELFEGRHPHDQYYRAKPKSQFKPKPRPKKTLWYGEEQYDGWTADIKSRYPDASAYYDEETEEVVAMSGDKSKSYGKWSKRRKGNFRGVSFYQPRPTNTVTKFSKRMTPVKVD